MYQEHFGLRQAPFSLTPQAACFHQGLHGPTLDALEAAVLAGQGLLLVSGPPGTGKTMLCHMLVEKLRGTARIASSTGQEIESNGVLRTLQDLLGIEQPDIHAPFRQLERRLQQNDHDDRHIVLAIDDAQQLSLASLEMLNRLCALHLQGRQAVQLILFAEKSFRKTLAQGRLRTLRARVAHSVDLTLLNRRQVADYLQFRLSAAGYSGQAQFPEPLAALITRASRGMLKHVNIIADKAMMAAFAENLATVNENHVKAAIGDTHFPRPGFTESPMLMAACAIALVALGAVSWLLWRPAAAPVAPPPLAAAPAASAVVIASRDPSLEAAGSPELGVAERGERFASIPEALGPTARALLIASHGSIDTMPSGNWCLQLRAIPATNATRLETFLANAEKAIKLHQLTLFIAREDPQQTVLVLYGSYPSEQAAYADIPRLPAWIRNKGIQARSFKTLQQGAAKTTVANGMLAGKDLVATH